MSLNLQDSVTTPQDLKSVILEVRKYAKWFSQYSIKAKVLGNKTAEAPNISETTVELIKDWAKAKPISQKSLDELIAALEVLQDKSPRITITLAAAASNGLKKSLVDWCRQNINPDILVDFRFNSTILGGLVVQYGSHVYDWSFRRQILANTQKFPEVLRRV